MGASHPSLERDLTQIEVFSLFEKLPRCVPIRLEYQIIFLDIRSTFSGTHPLSFILRLKASLAARAITVIYTIRCHYQDNLLMVV